MGCSLFPVIVVVLCICNNQICFALHRKPNVLLIITDDQDTLSSVPISKTVELVANKGGSFLNSFCNTPLCCPSRSSLLTGLYQHNTKVWNNSESGNCNSVKWQKQHEPSTYANILHQSGYRTFFAGKYLNQYGKSSSGGLQHVPIGWDWWAGLKGNSRYYNYSLSINGTERYFENRYLTDHIRDLALEFLREQQKDGPPFLMMLSPPAPHAPYTPAPRHQDCYPNATVPRTPNFNPPVEQKDKHWMLRSRPWPLPSSVVSTIDEFWRRRWCTLLSVDEMVSNVVEELRRMFLLDDTYVIFTSDNGYHLGHFGLPWDKRQPYDTDVRVPLMVRGPGVRRRIFRSAVMTADLAPTILDMAGLPASASEHMDGRSFLPLLRGGSEHRQNRAILVEHSGEGGAGGIPGECPRSMDLSLFLCTKDAACKCQDAVNNTYSCFRMIGRHRDFSFCKFRDGEGFVEAYDLRKDPFQMRNLAPHMHKGKINSDVKLLTELESCSGAICFSKGSTFEDKRRVNTTAE